MDAGTGRPLGFSALKRMGCWMRRLAPGISSGDGARSSYLRGLHCSAACLEQGRRCAVNRRLDRETYPSTQIVPVRDRRAVPRPRASCRAEAARPLRCAEGVRGSSCQCTFPRRLGCRTQLLFAMSGSSITANWSAACVGSSALQISSEGSTSAKPSSGPGVLTSIPLRCSCQTSRPRRSQTP